MDIRGFQVWLSAARGLTRAQRREALAVLSGRSEGEASKAAIELGVDEARRCPHCASEGAVSRGMARGLRRYQCKGCGRTFNALSGTPLSGLHHKERWLSFGASLAKGETVKASAARCDVAVSTAFRWRHRFLAAARSDSEVLKGIVEADETYVLESRKGARGLGRTCRSRCRHRGRRDGEFRLQLPGPLIDEVRRAQHRKPVDFAAIQHLTEDQPGFDCLAHTHIVGIEEPDRVLAQRHHEGRKLIGARREVQAARASERAPRPGAMKGAVRPSVVEPPPARRIGLHRGHRRVA